MADFVFSNLDGQMRALSRLALFHATSVVAVLSFSPMSAETASTGFEPAQSTLLALALLGQGDGANVRAVTPEHLAQMERYRAAVAAAKQTQDHAQWAISALDDVEKPMLLGPDLEAAIAKAEQNIATLDGLLLHLEAGLEADDAAQNAELLLLRQSRLAQVNSLNGLRATEATARRYVEATARAYALRGRALVELTAAQAHLAEISARSLSHEEQQKLLETLGL